MTFYFFFSHFIQVFLFPPGLNLLLGLIGFLLWRRWKLFSKTLIIVSFSSLWLLSTPIIAWQLLKKLEYQYPALQINSIAKQHITTSAIVVLGGGDGQAPEYENNLAVSDDTLGRLNFAAYLYHKLYLPIIVSGGGDKGAPHTEADLMKEVLLKNFKVPVKWKEDKSLNTADESRFLAPIFKQHGISTIYLVTNAWHIPRSVYAFKSSGVNVIPAPMGYTVLDSGQSILNYLPSIAGLGDSVVAIHEYIGMLWYYFIT